MEKFLKDAKWPYQQAAARNLESIRQLGISAWLEAQERRWSCASCDAAHSWWDDASLAIQGQAQATAQPTAQTQPQATAQTQPQATAQPLPGGGLVHTVVAGDTLFALSLQYNVSIDDIYALNGLNSQSILSIGQKIVIKAGSGTQVPAQQPTVAPTAAPNQPAATQQPWQQQQQ